MKILGARMGEQTLTISNGHYLVKGIQLKPRSLVPKRLGDFVLWLFFHQLDTKTEVVISPAQGPWLGLDRQDIGGGK